mmetsp:Transcript_29615/g.64632  ORF Transcript_29615/g.64632 Transcript_29615/m.64632 type:complete len:309 (-) Transcript_29615:562-1488(-)
MAHARGGSQVGGGLKLMPRVGLEVQHVEVAQGAARRARLLPSEQVDRVPAEGHAVPDARARRGPRRDVWLDGLKRGIQQVHLHVHVGVIAHVPSHDQDVALVARAPVPRDCRGHSAFQGQPAPLQGAEVKHLHIIEGSPTVDSPDDVHLLVNHHSGVLAPGKGRRRTGLNGQVRPYVGLHAAQRFKTRHTHRRFSLDLFLFRPLAQQLSCLIICQIAEPQGKIALCLRGGIEGGLVRHGLRLDGADLLRGFQRGLEHALRLAYRFARAVRDFLTVHDLRGFGDGLLHGLDSDLVLTLLLHSVERFLQL